MLQYSLRKWPGYPELRSADYGRRHSRENQKPGGVHNVSFFCHSTNLCHAWVKIFRTPSLPTSFWGVTETQNSQPFHVPACITTGVAPEIILREILFNWDLFKIWGDLKRFKRSNSTPMPPQLLRHSSLRLIRMSIRRLYLLREGRRKESSPRSRRKRVKTQNRTANRTY